MRLAPATVRLLEERGKKRGEAKSRLAQRLIEEGLRMEVHPGIVFRDGPAGRRPGLAAGPDVWEVIRTVQNTDAKGEDALAATAEWLGLSTGQVRGAVAYYADYRDEIDDWIDRVDEEAERAEQAWRRQQEALA